MFLKTKLIHSLNFLFLALAMLLVVQTTVCGQSAEPITVESRGRGLTMLDAKKDAIINALRQVVGEYVESDTVLENEKIVTDTITAFSNAESVKSELINSTRKGDYTVVTCKVTIVPAQIVGKLREARDSVVIIDGESIAAELEVGHDIIELQKETLDKQFNGLAVKMLVARLVDRNGKTIENARNLKSDIMMQDDEYTIALNIQVSYDLEKYKEIVFENLSTLFRSVARKSLRNKIYTEPRYLDPPTYSNVYVKQQAFTQDKSSFKKWTRIPSALGKGKGYTFAINVDPRLFVVFLSSERNGNGLHENFDVFFLPIELKGSIMKWGHYGAKKRMDSEYYEYSMPNMRVILNSKSGDFLVGKNISLAQTASGGNRGRDKVSAGEKELIPFSEPFWRWEGNQQFFTWMFIGENKTWDESLVSKKGGNYPLLISPRFGWEADSNGIEFGDSVMIRDYITISKDDFDTLGEIKFEFWDPRAE